MLRTLLAFDALKFTRIASAHVMSHGVCITGTASSSRSNPGFVFRATGVTHERIRGNATEYGADVHEVGEERSQLADEPGSPLLPSLPTGCTR